VFERELRLDGSVAAWTTADGVRYATFTQQSDRDMTVFRNGAPYLTITLDRYGNPATVHRADGRREDIETSLYGTVTRRMVDGVAVLERVFDRAGRLLTVVDADGETCYSYDGAGNVSQILLDGEILQSTEFDPAGRPVEVRHHDGTVERTTWSDGGRVLSAVRRDGLICDVRRDSAGRIVSIEERGGDREWFFAHAPDGRITRVESTATGVSTLLYTSTGAHVGFRYADGSLLRREYQPGGRIVIEGPAGNRGVAVIDGAGRLLSFDDGSRVIYRRSGHSVSIERDGRNLREVEFDRFGRIIRRSWPDGTSEELTWGDHGRRIALTDRRGGRHEITLDHHRRPATVTGPDGSSVTYRYERRRIVEHHGDGTTIEYVVDPAGDVQEKRINGVSVGLRHVRPDGTVREEHFARDGSPLATREFDFQNRLIREWAPGGALVYSAENSGPGILHLLREGHSATQEAVVPALTYRYRLGSGDAWTIERTILGRIAAVTAPGGSRGSIVWNPSGRPERIIERDPLGRELETQFVYEGQLLQERTSPGETPLRIDETEEGRRLTLTAGGARRVVTTGPYGVVTGETLSFSEGEATVASVRSLDAAGRTREVTTLVAGTPTARVGAVGYEAAGWGMHLETGAGNLELERSGEAITLRIDDTDAIEITGDAVAVAERVFTGRRSLPTAAAETAFMDVRRSSGFVETVAATVSLRNGRGQVTVEHDLDGAFRLFRYDDAGRVTAASGTGTGTPVAVDGEIRRGLGDAWNNVALSVRPPEVPAMVALRSFPDSRADQTEPGFRREWNGLAITYDATTDLPNGLSVSAGDAVPEWTIRRDLLGNPLFIRETTTGREWSAATVTWDTPHGVITVRSWEFAPAGSEAGGQEIPRYRPGGSRTATPAAETEADLPRGCIEVRRDHVLIAIIEPTAIHVPFTDARGSVRGMARLERDTRVVRYAPGPSVPPVIDPAFAQPGRTREALFPIAVPYDRVWYGMVHLPGTAALLSDTRLYIPATARFTSRDPALHHLDWYLYAAGDPINLIDPAGTIFTGTRRDLADTQQGGEWRSTPLGRSSRHTISSSGCVLTAVSNTINTVAGRKVTNPGALNESFMEGFYSGDALLSPEAAGDALAAVTGRHVEVVSFDPREVDMARIAATLSNDAAQEYTATARIRTYADSPDGTRTFYEHTVNVAGFDQAGMPIFVDTSNRNRVTLEAQESVLRYDVYAYSRCRSY
jgi:RHS repeat-associated protein